MTTRRNVRMWMQRISGSVLLLLTTHELPAQMRWLPSSGVQVHAGVRVAFDPDRQRAVLFGGQDGYVTFDDTLEWDGTDWISLAPAHRPPARTGHAMAYDAARRRIVMYGGFDTLTQSWRPDV